MKPTTVGTPYFLTLSTDHGAMLVGRKSSVEYQSVMVGTLQKLLSIRISNI